MNTTTLTDSQRQQLRAQLEQRKEQLLQELDAIQRDTLGVAEAAGRGDAEPAGSSRDQANSMAAGMVRDAEAARDHAELVAVRAALERIAAGSYGECTDCGQSVGVPRLLAQPAAARCIACQSKAEAQGHR
ncbi:TraR/DksA family transcriptional regulator [Alicycliphilus denitrificans]|uniref:TraR/DksA family transcriptional regulator n=1 Tax=Alicycliphilus denitrificans TaxID=179636 RepID=UPI00384EF9F3